MKSKYLLYAIGIVAVFYAVLAAVIMRGSQSDASASLASEIPGRMPVARSLDKSEQQDSGQAVSTLPLTESDSYTLRYEIDRSSVSWLYYQELTLVITVNQVDNVQVSVDGIESPYVYRPERGDLLVTTAGNNVEVTITGVDSLDGLGTFSKAVLKDDRGFAVSFGMDDNQALKEQTAVLDSYGWQATYFLMGSIIDDVRDEDWIVDAPYLREQLAKGWALGNHTWDHSCDVPINHQTIVDGYNRVQEIVSSSSVPNYQVISFAAPCFIAEYHPVILEFRDTRKTPVLFNESGADSPMLIDPNAADIIAEMELNEMGAWPFDFDRPVGRAHEFEIDDTQGAMDIVAWMASQYNGAGHHFWYNILTHGQREDQYRVFADYVYKTHGPEGTNQIWVAPSDRIYSYLLVQDRAAVSSTVTSK